MELHELRGVGSEYVSKFLILERIEHFISNGNIPSMTVSRSEHGTLTVKWLGFTYLLALEHELEQRHLAWKLCKYQLDRFDHGKVEERLRFSIEGAAVTVPHPKAPNGMTTLQVKDEKHLEWLILSLFELW